MSVRTKEELMAHFGHKLDVGVYAGAPTAVVECLDCYVVLFETEESNEDPERPVRP